MPESLHPSSPTEVTGWERTLKQAFELWINPELERRKSAGSLETPFRLAAAQVLFSDDGPTLVRLNEEVRGLFQVRVSRDVTAGEPVHTQDISDFEGIELLSDERDYGHFTLISHGDRWKMLFDFSRNKGHASELVDLAEQFAQVAEQSMNSGYYRPFIDNLFSSCELVAKARLITTVLRKDASRRHGLIHSTINSWRKLGNVSDDFVDLFNEVSSARGPARYGGRVVARKIDKDVLRIVRAEIQTLRERYSPRFKANTG